MSFQLHIIPFLLISCLPSLVMSIMIGGFIIPHGDFCYDPSLVNYANGSLELHETATYVGSLIQVMQPDIIVLSTPHGMALSQNIALYENSESSGFAMVGGDLHNASFPQYKVPMGQIHMYNDTALRLALNRSDVEGLDLWGDSEDAPLRWGEVLPLTFLQPYVTQPNVSLAILSHPTRRLTDAAGMMNEMIDLGSHLFTYFESLPQRVAIIISSDLAHTHLANGPYGYSPSAQPFDDAIGKWAHTLNIADLQLASTFVNDAKSCGWTGIVMLHGMLSQLHVNHWKSTMYANYHPTYYGMMVASFLRTNETL